MELSITKHVHKSTNTSKVLKDFGTGLTVVARQVVQE